MCNIFQMNVMYMWMEFLLTPEPLASRRLEKHVNVGMQSPLTGHCIQWAVCIRITVEHLIIMSDYGATQWILVQFGNTAMCLIVVIYHDSNLPTYFLLRHIYKIVLSLSHSSPVCSFQIVMSLLVRN